MKVKVLKKFKDIHTGQIYFSGDILEITPERFKEIMTTNKKLVVNMEEEPEERRPAFSRSDLEKMKVEELRKLAAELKVEEKGKKEELINRIIETEELKKNEESEN